MEPLEKSDIQGFLLKGYAEMNRTRYAFLRVQNADRAKAWLARISLEVADGNYQARKIALNVALAYHGLKALGLREENLRQFSREFREGLTDAHRSRLLGDEGEDNPANWRWGGCSGDLRLENIHVLLLVFAANDALLDEYWQQLEPVIRDHGLDVVAKLDGALTPDGHNTFGFNDGISQPDIAGNHPDTDPDNTVAAGEFLLGYKNEYGVLPESPIIPASNQQGDLSLLPTIKPNEKDLGRNGSYLVFRQMQSHAEKFWAFCEAKSNGDNKAAIKLASKMFGRWPSGAPLALFPDHDPGTGENDSNLHRKFGYHAEDKEGRRCPIGSHIRRTNPRDQFEDNSAAQSLSLTKKHRIIRRGRNYKITVPDGQGGEREELGLHFMCFNADISHQFEFIQHTWANFPSFEQLHNDPDPIIGVVANPPPGTVQDFTVQGLVNRHVHGLERFVTIRGGVYLFFPSITAIKYLATI